MLDTVNVTFKASYYKFIILETYDVVEVKTNNVIFKCPNLEQQFRDITLLVILKTSITCLRGITHSASGRHGKFKGSMLGYGMPLLPDA